MKRFFLFLIGSLLMISCQEKETIIVSDDDYVELDSESAKQEFAVILSKAVYENEALREFLKSEALTQFDNTMCFIRGPRMSWLRMVNHLEISFLDMMRSIYFRESKRLSHA